MQNHINHASGYKFHGGNALILENAAKAKGYTTPQWLTLAQAAKLNLAPLPGAAANQVILNERVFNVYNLEDMVATHQTAAEVAEEERAGAAIDQQQAERDYHQPTLAL